MNEILLKKIVYGIVVIAFVVIAIFYLASDSGSDNNSPNSYQVVQADSASYTVPSRPSLRGYLIKVVIVTLLIILLIIIGAKWYGKLTTMGNTTQKIKILAKNHIGSKQLLLLIRIEGRKLLLGVTDHSINLISDLGDSDDTEDGQYESVQEHPSFSSFLKQFRKDKNE